MLLKKLNDFFASQHVKTTIKIKTEQAFLFSVPSPIPSGNEAAVSPDNELVTAASQSVGMTPQTSCLQLETTFSLLHFFTGASGNVINERVWMFPFTNEEKTNTE